MKIIIVNIFLVLFILKTQAQDIDLFKIQDNENKKADSQQTEITKYTFKSSRIINGHSIEHIGGGILDFRIMHRFNPLNGGIEELYGLDGSTIRFGLDYGITDRLTVGFGRSSYQKQYDGFVKYKILQQTTGYHSMPLSIGLAGGLNYKSAKEGTQDDGTINQLSYFSQILIARKFNDYLSIQITPTMVHYNRALYAENENNLYAVGAGFRLRLSKRVNLTGEYFYQLNQNQNKNATVIANKNLNYNTLSVGVDIETGGHVFQLHFSNSTGMTEKTFINETNNKWDDGGIRLGFNISRVFVIKKPKNLN